VHQISSLLRLCNQHRIPVIPFGAGSGFEGGINAVHGGVTVDTSRHMNKIIQVNEEDFDCVVEAGVTREQLNHSLHETGLWYLFKCEQKVGKIKSLLNLKGFLLILERMLAWEVWLQLQRRVQTLFGMVQ